MPIECGRCRNSSSIPTPDIFFARGFSAANTISGTIVDVASYARRVGATWCFPNYHYVDRKIVSSLHAAAIRVVPWTPDQPREWQRLRDCGCDGIITDLPAEAVAWRSGMTS
jgi:glycerophosphoryl diester phosphodiesterase